MHSLQLTDVQKSYGVVQAVKGVSLDIPAGEFVVLVGPSGCGKSTLLRAIAGLEEISAGDIVLDGRSIVKLQPKDRDIAMVFQNYALYPYLSVFENIAFGLRARHIPDAEVRKQVHWAAELLDITQYLERQPRALSGGQRQRVAIGRAIVRDAKLFLFDEPLSNLDAKLRDGMREEIKRLHQQLGKTFIYVTHDQIEAMTLADRIVLLNNGEIEQQGAPLELFERPDNRFVAGFLGSPSMNFIDVSIDQNGQTLVLPDGQTLTISPDCGESSRIAGRTLVWGVRPEHFTQAKSGKTFAATMEVVQPTGSRTFTSFQLGQTHVVAELDAHSISKPGQKLELSVAMNRTLFLDPQSGQAVYHCSAGRNTKE